MWYLLVCLLLILILSEKITKVKYICLIYLVYCLRLELANYVTLVEYIIWCVTLLNTLWFHTYLNFKKVYLVDTIIISCIKLLELVIITFPLVSFHLPEIISQHLFKLDNIFLSGIVTCLVLRESGYNIKVDVKNMRSFYLLFGVVMIHVIAYVF